MKDGNAQPEEITYGITKVISLTHVVKETHSVRKIKDPQNSVKDKHSEEKVIPYLPPFSMRECAKPSPF